MVSSQKNDTLLDVQTDKSNKSIKNKKNNTTHPVELEYWYILPAIRRSISTYLKSEKKLKQKEIASILGITEAGVSQYLKGTRGVLKSTDDEIIELPDWIHSEVSISCDQILDAKGDESIFLREVNRLIIVIRDRASEFLCKLHYQLGFADEDCDICLSSSS